MHLGYIWEAFWCLTSSRSYGYSTGPIPLTEIRAYIELFSIADVHMFVTCIRAMDAQYLKKLRDDQARTNGK